MMSDSGGSKYYWVQLTPRRDGVQWPQPFRVEADECEEVPGGSVTLRLKRDGEVVATVREHVAAWWTEEVELALTLMLSPRELQSGLVRYGGGCLAPFPY